MDPVSTARAIAVEHGIEPTGVTEISGGVANYVFRLGQRLVLRMPRSAAFAADLRKEIAVIPVVRGARLRTPAIVAEGKTSTAERRGGGARGDSPYVVMERVEGNDLVEQNAPGAWVEVGREIGLLHRIEPQEISGVPVDPGADGRPVDGLVEQGYLDAGTAQWLAGWMEELGERFDREAPAVLLHGDLAPQNIMVDHAGRFAALIDWGDAAWGPRAMEFAKLRLEDVVRVLPAYKDVVGVRFAPGELEAAVLWFHLQWGLSNLMGPPRPGERHWTAPPASRLTGVLRFVASGPPEPWDTVIKKVDLWV
jgi:aminoglycoside phosphotransferase (APT) family kinase protein